MDTIRNKSDEIEVRNKIIVISFFCSLLVIWIHTYNLDTYGITEASTGLSRFVYYLEDTWNNFTGIAVPFFFFISGWLFFRTFELKIIREKYKSRIKSILIPYLVWCTFYYFVFAILTSLPLTSRFMNASKSHLSVLGWLESLWPNEYYTLWFLKEIIIYISLCPLIYTLLKNRYIGGAILFLLFANEITGCYHVPFLGYLYYLAGAYLAINFKHIEYKRSGACTIASCFFFIILALFRFKPINHVIIRLVFFVATWFFLDFLPLKKPMPWWMKISFFTYVAHDLFLEAFEKIVLIVFGKNAVFALLDYILAPIVVFLVLAVIAACLKKYTPKIWSIVTGMR